MILNFEEILRVLMLSVKSLIWVLQTNRFIAVARKDV